MRSSDTHVRTPTQASEIEREEVLQERDTERGDREREEREKRQGVMYQQQGRKEKGMKVPEVCRRHLHDCEAKSRTCRRSSNEEVQVRDAIFEVFAHGTFMDSRQPWASSCCCDAARQTPTSRMPAG